MTEKLKVILVKQTSNFHQKSQRIPGPASRKCRNESGVANLVSILCSRSCVTTGASGEK